MDRARVLYYIGGWLFSSGVTRTTRQPPLRALIGRFVSAHVYSSASKFRRDAPESLRGVEEEMQRRNDVDSRSGLLFPSTAWFEFAKSVETGYRNAFTQPYLLSTFCGNLPDEIMRVVKGALEVRLKWKSCVDAVSAPTLGAQDAKWLFDFFTHKFHNVRCGEYCRRLSYISKQLTQAKATGVALRTGLKASVGKGKKVSDAGSKDLSRD